MDTKDGWQAFVLRLERAQTDEHAKSSGFELAEWLHDMAIRGIDLQFYELRCLELNGLEVCGFKVKAPFSIIFFFQFWLNFWMGQRLKGRENSKNLQEKLDSLDNSFWMPKVRIQLGREFRVNSRKIRIERKGIETSGNNEQISVSKKGKEKLNKGKLNKGKEQILPTPAVGKLRTAKLESDAASTAEPDLGNSSMSASGKESQCSTNPEQETTNSKKSPWLEAWKLKHGAVGECSICLDRIDDSENRGKHETKLACGVY